MICWIAPITQSFTPYSKIQETCQKNDPNLNYSGLTNKKYCCGNCCCCSLDCFACCQTDFLSQALIHKTDCFFRTSVSLFPQHIQHISENVVWNVRWSIFSPFWSIVNLNCKRTPFLALVGEFFLGWKWQTFRITIASNLCFYKTCKCYCWGLGRGSERLPRLPINWSLKRFEVEF